MTRFTLLWVQSAEEELVEIWMNSRDRNEVTRAAEAIERDLRVDAETKGMELAEGLRALNEPPLRVIFTVQAAERIVEVLRVRGI